MKKTKRPTLSRILLCSVCAAALTTPAFAQGVNLNYDALSSIEEPLAFEVEDVTISLNGLLDMPLALDFDDEGDFDVGFVGNFQVTAETQLRNRWTVGVAYFGQYETDPGTLLTLSGESDHYSDNIAGFVGGVWGTVLGGNVNGVVRENTRRTRGTGNAFLAFDNTYGGFDDLGGAYIGRYGPAELSAVVDEQGNFDLGAMWSRPIGNKDYRFTARFTHSEFTSSDGTTRFDSNAGGLVGEFIYGSYLFDVGFGFEDLSSAAVDAERWFASSGVRWKKGALTLSLEGHYGEVEGDDEVAAAFGARYDIARGLSLNLGVNYAEAMVDVGGVTLVDTEEAQAVLSLRYSF